MSSKEMIAKNRKAYHDYEILDRYEAGIVLRGTEVKAIRDGRLRLSDSYAAPRNGELWLENCFIGPYRHSSFESHAPTRSRKLLLHRREINKLIGMIVQKGLTIVPLGVYFKDGLVKLELAVARGKKSYDKRESSRKKAIQREIERELKRSRR